MILLAGGLLGFIAVAFGAYAEHGLRAAVADDTFHSVMTAVRYNLVHAGVVAAIGLALRRQRVGPGDAALSRVAWLFVVGTALFSFTIYLSAAWGMSGFTRATPFGGLLLMGAWLALAWVGVTSYIYRPGGE